ncbi:glycoside hydrolase family 16 protein [Curtobacterium sp. 9128]|uniref:glycoside hydrolase family 16 protein n=1 Tax=Curtobacterium sp. 9128 TaxID=1793722 RepID=UPI0011A480B8|nr:glycoside hydrolase family 16 protein [Curtobacterium sp. 9128]
MQSEPHHQSPARPTKVARALLVLATVVAASVVLGTVTTADARSWVGDPASPAPTVVATTPPGEGTAPTFSEDFDTPAAAGGQFAATYADAWQPYPDGMGDKYWSGPLVSAHDGVMDVALDGSRGAAGTFGTPDGAWSHVGGTFSVRARATGGDGNGAAFMLWPTSNVWSEGELDFPEGDLDGTVGAFSHKMVPGQEWQAEGLHTDATWRQWHTYTTEWIPGVAVRYSVDGVIVLTVTKDVPTTAHRYMFQVGDVGAPGHLEIDWVRIWDR